MKIILTDILDDDFAFKSEIERQLEVIEKYYPGVNNLTNYEAKRFADFNTLHKFQTWVSYKRMFEYDKGLEPK